MMLTTRTLFTAALLLTSATAFAQQETLEALQTPAVTGASANVAADRNVSSAQRLANAVDAYNTRPDSGAVAASVIDTASVSDTPISPAARQLAFDIRAYNDELRPMGDTVDYSNTPNRRALALGREITRFNQTGGSLDVVGQSSSTLQ